MSQAAPVDSNAPAGSSLRAVRVALIGNPNTGKTTLFNALTGHRARVGNYSGVTVEKREGEVRSASRPINLVDLPGSYSLAAHSPDELVAVRVLLGHLDDEPRPDAVVVVADASNLERNLFLATQVIELGLPVILALNMIDVAEKNGLTIDVARIGEALGVPALAIVARDAVGIDALQAMLERIEDLPIPKPLPVYPEDFLLERDGLLARLAELDVDKRFLQPFLVKRPLVEVDGMIEKLIVESGGAEAKRAIDDARQRLTEKGLRLRTIEAVSRHRWIRAAVAPAIREEKPEGGTSQEFSDKIDTILTHRVWGTAVFVILMAIVFQAIYSWSAPMMDAIDGVISALGDLVAGVVPAGPLQSFLVDGVIAGVGGVLIFLPQICVLFLFIALLEDVGYMARAAFLMDRLLSRVGLSGRSFIPMLSSFACAVPGIMSTRTIEDRRDRIATMIVLPLMSCSARLPVYTIFIAAFIPSHRVLGILNLQGLVLLSMYLLGILVAVPVTWLVKRTLLKARTPSFLIELPPYRRPLLLNVVHRMYERGKEFVVRAGTIILAVSVLIWALTYYPRPAAITSDHQERVSYVNDVFAGKLADAGVILTGVAMPEGPDDVAAIAEGRGNEETFEAWEAKLHKLNAQVEGEYMRNSYLARLGHMIEPAVEPLGWDWRIGMATLASFPAREVVVATLGVIFDLGGDAEGDEQGLIQNIRDSKRADGSPLFTIPVALSVMVFFALCMQCAATLAIMKRETNSWRWPAFTFAYMTGLAYIAALLTYQVFTHLV